MIPVLEIHGWNPGTKAYDEVSIVELLGAGAHRTFLSKVTLETAQQIVNWNKIVREIAALVKS